MKRSSFVVALWTLTACVPARAGTPVAPLIQGYMAQRSGSLDEALTDFRQALDADPESVAIRVEIARILGSEKKYSEALEVMDAGLRLRPDDTELVLFKARLLEVMGRGKEAADLARDAARRGGNAEAFGLAVRLLEQQGRADDALEEANRWAEVHADSPEPHFALGRILVHRNDLERARQEFGKALQIDPTHRASLRALAAIEEEAGNLLAAEALYRRVIDVNPHDVDARFRLGQVLLKQSKVEEALEVFGAAERRAGGDPALRFRLGLLLLQADRPGDAEAVFRAMAGVHGDNLQVWYLLGVSLLAQEKHVEALDAFEKIPKTASEYPDALVRRAIALDSLKRGEEARRLLSEWLAEHTDDEEVNLALAGLQENAGDYRAGVELLEGFLARHKTQNPRIFFTLGVLYDKLKDWRRSAEYMKRSLEVRPNDPHALNYLGYTYAEHGVYLEEAEGFILRALELKPDDGFITDSLGWVYYKQARYAEAAETLRKAVELAPDDPVIWEHLGDALKALGETERAREAYKKTLELAPETDSARRKLEELR